MAKTNKSMSSVGSGRPTQVLAILIYLKLIRGLMRIKWTQNKINLPKSLKRDSLMRMTKSVEIRVVAS